MAWHKILALVSLSIFLISMAYHFIRLIRLGKPSDFSRSSGDTSRAIRYSFTGAMSPKHKESAFLHLPTYSAGIAYHIGTFLCIALFFPILFDINIPEPINQVLAFLLAVSSISGLGILAKRMVTKKLRKLSNPDDYISNLLVTAFQVASVLMLMGLKVSIIYFMISSLLLLYFPLGKLKHAVYFFAARYHLGFFYGWRGVWPPQN